MELRKRCLRCVEIYATLGAPLADWRREAGTGYSAVMPLLVETDHLARRWSRPGGPAMRIVDHGDGCAVAVCDDELSPPVELTRTDRVMHRPSERRLRKLICDALDLTVSHDELCRLPGVIRIGDWQPKPAARFPVILIVALTPAHFVELLIRTRSTSVYPAIVLTLTRAMWSRRADAALEREKITLVPLDDVLEPHDDTWKATGTWDDYLGAFVQRAGIKLPPGFSTIRKKTRVSKASATAGKIKAELKEWYRPARKHLIESGTLLPVPELKDIAKACGIDQSTVSRWLNGKYREKDKELMLLWQNIDKPESVRNFRH